MKSIRVIVFGVNAAGNADVLKLEVELTEAQFLLGEHYSMAAEMAAEQDFTPQMAIDQQEVPREMILKALDWVAEERDQPEEGASSPSAPKF